MPKFILTAAAAALLGLSTLASPASAAPIKGLTLDSHATAVETVQYRRHRRHFRHRPICRTERVVRRGPHGRRIVRMVRVCR